MPQAVSKVLFRLDSRTAVIERDSSLVATRRVGILRRRAFRESPYMYISSEVWQTSLCGFVGMSFSEHFEAGPTHGNTTPTQMSW